MQLNLVETAILRPAIIKLPYKRRAMDMGVTKSANLKFQHFAENNCL